MVDRTPYPTLLDLPIANLAQILSCLSVVDLLKLEASSKYISSVVKQCLSDSETLEVSDESPAVVENVLEWAKLKKKINNVRSFRATGRACAAVFDAWLAEKEGSRGLWPKLQHLQLEYCRPFKDSHVSFIVQHWPQLTMLDLGGCVNITDASVYAIADNLPNLLHLNCSNWMYISDDAVSYLARKLPGLRTIKLDGCARITSRSITALAQHCPDLQSISTSTCFRLCNSSLTAWAGHRSLTTAIFKQCPKLSAISSLSTCPSLTCLDISGCPLVSDAEIHSLLATASKGKHLHRLNLQGCVGLTGSVLQSISSFCPNLRHLNVSRVDVLDDHLFQLALGCHNIHHLHLDWCTKVTDIGLVSVLKANKALASLSIEGLYNVTDCVLEVLSTCGSLLSLNARMCVHFSIDGLVKLGSAVNLKSIHLAGIMDEASTKCLVSELTRCCTECRLCY